MEGYPPVGELLPHSPPMVLLSRFVSKERDLARCEIDIGPESLFFEAGGVPSYIGIEYMAQTIGVYDGAIQYDNGEGPRIGFLLGGPKAMFYCEKFGEGTTLVAESRVTWEGGKVVQFSCTICNATSGELLAMADFNVYAPDEEDALFNQEAM